MTSKRLSTVQRFVLRALGRRVHVGHTTFANRLRLYDNCAAIVIPLSVQSHVVLSGPQYSLAHERHTRTLSAWICREAQVGPQVCCHFADSRYIVRRSVLRQPIRFRRVSSHRMMRQKRSGLYIAFTPFLGVDHPKGQQACVGCRHTTNGCG